MVLWKGINGFCCCAANISDLKDKSSYKPEAFIYIQAQLLAQIYETNPLFNMYPKTGGRKATQPTDLKWDLVSVEKRNNLKQL